ncbi:MAG: M23 family metallopeptidase [Verrucomicrobia bacterium]|nr:M23 family metallopeptidase [Verrucomicrobiota bacterium]
MNTTLPYPILACLLVTLHAVGAVSDGFDYPIGSDRNRRYTEAADGDGWYSAQEFGDFYSVNGKYHLGEDWNAETGGNTDCGLPVYAASSGTIVFAGTGTGWGKVIIVRHDLPDGTQVETLYGHLQNQLKTSGSVSRSVQIGTIGNGDGAVSSCHLHFEVRFSNCPNWGSPGPGYSAAPKPTGWTDPSDFIDARRSLSTTPQTGSIRVSIVPQAAAEAGAQWRVVGETAWRNSGTIKADVALGEYQVEFKTIAGWGPVPPNKVVTLTAANREIWINSDAYSQVQQLGSIRVSIVPQAAADAGAQWRVVGETTWRNSGTISLARFA